MGFFFDQVPHQKPVCSSPLCHTRNMRCPPLSFRFDSPVILVEVYRSVVPSTELKLSYAHFDGNVPYSAMLLSAKCCKRPFWNDAFSCAVWALGARIVTSFIWNARRHLIFETSVVADKKVSAMYKIQYYECSCFRMFKNAELPS